MRNSLVFVTLALWLLNPINAFAQPELEDNPFGGPPRPREVDHDPLRPKEWYGEDSIKWRARRVDSIDYGAVASSDTLPFWLGEPISRMAFSPDGKLLASGTYSGPIWIWSSTSGEVVAKLKSHNKWVSAIAFSPDSKQLISGSGDCTLRVWDIAKQLEVKQLDKLEDTPLQIVIHPDRSEIYWRDSGRVWHWNMKAKKEESVQQRWQAKNALALAVNSRQLAAGTADGSVYVWDFEREGNFGGQLANPAEGMAIAFDSQGQLHAAAFEPREGRKQISLYQGRGFRPPVRAQSVSEDFAYVTMAASAQVAAFANSRGECFLWDASGKRGGAYVNAEWPGGIALSFDGRRIATCDDSGAILIRSTDTGRRLSPYPLTTFARPLVQRITKDDPVRIAVHWAYPNQPIRAWSRWPRGDQMAILESMIFHWTGPDGARQELSPAESIWRDRNSLLSNPTLIMELKALGVEIVNNGPMARWRTLREPDFGKSGTHKLSVAGIIRLRGETDIAFQNGEISWEVVERDVLPLRQLAPIADEKLRTVVDPAVAKRIQLPVVDWGVYVFVDDKAGNRRIRFSHSTKFGFDRYEVLCAPHGEVVGVYFDHVTTCIAEGTTVSTPKGELPIESLAPGMEVWGYDVEERKKLPVRVQAVQQHTADLTLRIGRSRVTGEHPLFADGKWRTAASLRGGERAIGLNGELSLPTPEQIHGNVKVYEIAVDRPHNFFAGELLVHNKSRDYWPDVDDPWYMLWPQRRHDRKQVWPKPADGKESE